MDRSSFPGGREQTFPAHLISDFCLLCLWPGLKLWETLRGAHLWSLWGWEWGCSSQMEAPGQPRQLTCEKCAFSDSTPGKSGFTFKAENLGANTMVLSLSFSGINVFFSIGKLPAGRRSQACVTPGAAPFFHPQPPFQRDFGAPAGDEYASFYFAVLNPVPPSSFWWWGPSGLEGEWEAAWSLWTPVIQVPTPIPSSQR